MALEMEIKVRVDGFDETRERLPAMAGGPEPIDYADTYFARAPADAYTFQRFRLRETPEGATVTIKEKAEAAVEASLEHEFVVSDVEAFREFARLMGFAPLIEKRKRGVRYRLPIVSGPLAGGTVGVELIEVPGLGRFVELEVVFEKEGHRRAAEAALWAAFTTLGLARERIEPRPYTRMLYEMERSKENG